MNKFESGTSGEKLPVDTTGSSEVKKIDDKKYREGNDKIKTKEYIDDKLSDIFDFIEPEDDELNSLINDISNSFSNKEELDFLLKGLIDAFNNDEIYEFSNLVEKVNISKNTIQTQELDGQEKELDGQKKESEIIRNEKKEINKVLKKDISSILQRNGLDKHPALIDAFESGNFDEVINILKANDGKVFKSIAKELRKESPEDYKEFIDKLGLINPEFRNIGDNLIFDDLIQEKTLEGTVVTSETSSTLTAEKGDTVVEYTGDSRLIYLKGSDYKLEAKAGKNIGPEIQEIKDNFKEKTEGLNKELTDLNNISNFLELINGADLDIKKVKGILKKNFPDAYNNLLLENIDSLDQLKSSIITTKEQKELLKQDLLDKAKVRIKQVVDKNVKAAEKVDNNKKKILDFLSGLGFDAIDKTVTDNIIESKINKGNQKETFGFKNDIDIANGNLGINIDNDLNDFNPKEAEPFIRFMNIMLSGTEEGPVDIASIYTGTPIMKGADGKPISDKKGRVNELLKGSPLSTINQNFDNYKKRVV